jgi:catechol-2,3-dioxygenase
MLITVLQLATPQLDKQRAFYANTLGLPLTHTTQDSFTVQAGITTLTFQQDAPGDSSLYHLAFTVPHQKWEQAKDWITARTHLLSEREKQEFFFSSRNAHSLYFPDPSGSILEFIGYKDMSTQDQATGTFSAQDILAVNEIGLVVNDVPVTVENLKKRLGFEIYRNAFSETFAITGDSNGMFIIVKEGRLWAPNNETPSIIAPVHVTLLGVQAQQIHLDPYPYTIDIVPLTT